MRCADKTIRESAFVSMTCAFLALIFSDHQHFWGAWVCPVANFSRRTPSLDFITRVLLH